ncbi:UDP-2,4-diacetamido-2,4,6-trideoxy-beta-L-altropyranose hydrolase [Onishia taeanensis]|uniref:UDP-2,4-diacetamido-2,4, 6-trideoxy-beta-L-altropyranose hydrolase n=1 Tax=Onishia taeanensis TaxID=284577 RepID=A0A328XDK3_9GAMM|nr:UDP-2,4-diacetamido-2,4,6-trideoxy-beta-L-altropyranose hydrolase [Halomonas taeanensis]RAR56779.1 UDP-2,4-diacetamido-2,4,6-trideoxy-beta-L-altropyranose hydrolase [Halomonas taeanensis]
MRNEAPDISTQVVVFRADASLEIGTGHIMRCLTLAEALRKQGAECHFLCREHAGHLIDAIEARGFNAHRLLDESLYRTSAPTRDLQPDHAHWLGTSWESDAEACGPLIVQLAPDWLVVDHYALDARWEAAVLPEQTRLLVIDDLADRAHCAHLLLDQNLGREAEDYIGLVPAECRVLAGPQFALLRPEFAERRESSLARRHRHPAVKRLLISLGGVDKDNSTGQVLDALNACDLPNDLEITVVMGATAPWLEEVKTRAVELPWSTEVVVNVSDMARRMAEADLAIGAAGSTTWERCCLGLPTLMLVLAENQQHIAQSLHNAGAALTLGSIDSSAWKPQLQEYIAKSVFESAYRQTLTCDAANVTNGTGVSTLVGLMLEGER